MRIYCPEPLKEHHVHPLFLFRFTPEEKIEDIFKRKLPPNYFEQEATFVDKEVAEVIVLPNNFRSLEDAVVAYIRRYADEAERLGIPIFAFSWGDLTDGLVFDPRVYVFRLSAYRSRMSPRDIVMPTLVEDLGKSGISFREKKQKPTVSFCGQAGYKTLSQWIRYYLKIAWHRLINPARAIGVYWRRAAISACERSDLVDTNFVTRRSFSGAWKTIELKPEDARRQFIDSIVESDFVLTPKGDGNFSNRFLEALSLGRIPVIIDTDMPLPLEEHIPYEECVIRVPMHEVQKTPEYIREWYDQHDAVAFEAAQRKAREIFETYLREDVFFRVFFSKFTQLS